MARMESKKQVLQTQLASLLTEVLEVKRAFGHVSIRDIALGAELHMDGWELEKHVKSGDFRTAFDGKFYALQVSNVKRADAYGYIADVVVKRLA